MHNRRPFRIASTIGPVETGLLPALEAACSRRSAVAVEHDALERAERGGIRSGTHIREQELWQSAGIRPTRSDWYRIAESGIAGSGTTAREAAAHSAYTVLDPATFVTARPDLEI